MVQAIDLLAILVTLLLTGAEMAVGAVVHPVLSRLDDAAHAAAAKSLARVLGKAMPFWYAAALLGAIASLLARPMGGASWWACLASAVLVAATIPFSLICLVPINRRIESLDLGALPDGWKADRRRWDGYHTIRITMLVLASAALVAAAVWRPTAD